MSKVVIIGAGPAGITAAIYLKRGGIEPILIEKMMPGGKVSLTHKIDNYPGFTSIGGSDFANNLMNQLMENNIEITFDEVTEVTQKEIGFLVKTQYNHYDADAVIIATGTLERKLGIPGENEFFAKGVSTCAVCDGGFFKGKPMAIIGGGNSALEEALYLSSITDKVYVIHRRNEFRADQILVDRITKDPHIEILTPYVPIEVKGDKMVSSLVLENVETKEKKEININAMFAYIGSDANTSFMNIRGLLDEKGYIIVDSEMSTSIPGIFACGDCIKKNLRQVITACGDGAIAAMSTVHYLKK
jgi:thioredoxin reductase (NADPH)